MPIQVTCPSCNGSFKAPDSGAGKNAKCPKCAGVIEIPGVDGEEEILDAEEALPSSSRDNDLGVGPSQESLAVTEDRHPCPMCGEMIQRSAVKCRFCGEVFDRSMLSVLGGRAPDTNDPRWAKVRTGLATLYYSVIIAALTGLLIGIVAGTLGAMNVDGPNADPPAALLIVAGLGGFVILGAGIGMLVGYGFCANVPEISGARGFVIGSLVCLLANVLLSMAGGATDIESLNLLGSLVSIVGWILFILFIRTSAAYLGNGDLSTSATRFLIAGAVTFVGAIALGVVAGIGQAPAIMGVIGLFLVVAMLIGFVWFMRLIRSLMKTIDQRAGVP